MRLPESMTWLFQEVDLEAIDVERDEGFVLARVLERGRLEDVKWVLGHYGAARIHEFFRTTGGPELTARTLAFWRAYFDAENEIWKSPPSFRRTSSAPWPS